MIYFFILISRICFFWAINIYTYKNDRILVLDVKGLTEIGDLESKKIIIELGKYTVKSKLFKIFLIKFQKIYRYNITLVSIPGRDGEIVSDNGRFPNVTVSYSCFLPAKSIDELKLLLASYQKNNEEQMSNGGKSR